MSDADGLALALTPEQLDRLWQMVISPENDEERPAPPEGETGRVAQGAG